MAFCGNCGAKLERGARFCGECGTRVEDENEGKAVPGVSERPAFCGNCGAKLEADARFCGECGTPIADMMEIEPVHGTTVHVSRRTSRNASERVSSGKSWFNSFAVFKSSNWEKEWQKAAEDAAGEELGIIMTSEGRLVSQLDVKADELRDVIANYMRSADKRGVHYYYLDIEDNSIESADGDDVAAIVSLLRKIVNGARPKYLFILGNEEVINVATWENGACDGDEDVLSDLAYSTLDTNSPWEGQDFNASEALRVGRLPTTEGCFDDFQTYFENAKRGIGSIETIKSYGLSALVWKDESNHEYSAIAKDEVDTSPSVTLETSGERISASEPNLLFFNLHGSDEMEYWYGQKGGNYPEAMSPELFDDYPRCFFLGVEACYGARFVGLGVEESIVKTAMANRCLAFLGSSKIAYGTSSPDGTCADIVIGEYIRHIAKGFTAGDAHIAGLKKLTSASDMDDADIKTLAEFALYGDPSACTGKNKNIGAMKGMMKKLGGVPKGIHIPMPDVRKATKLYLAEVNEKIEKAVDDFAATLMPALRQKGAPVTQKTFKMKSGRLNQKMYSIETEHIRQIAKVYFDDNGKVHKAVMSK
ncbi:MAG: zinc ribbon domain-containing protein [Victivallales bacterium]|nr:zinc ribbon domain-containing protein [Victivallales bacterium]